MLAIRWKEYTLHARSVVVESNEVYVLQWSLRIQ